MNVSLARYALGCAVALIVFGSLGLAAVVLRRRYLPEWVGAVARLAEVVIGLTLLTALLEVLGTVGLFRLWAVTLGCLVIAVVSWRLSPAPARVSAPSSRARAPRLLSIVAVLAVLAVTAEWAIPTLQSYDFGVRSFDSVWYHLPWAASFARTGQITPLRFTDVEYLTAFYPATAELFHGLGIVLLARDTLSPALNLVWLWLVLLAAYCVGVPLGRGRLTVIAAALAMATPMMRFSQPGSAANDVVGIFFLVAAVALLLNARGARSALALGGAAAGLAVGVKLSMVAPALAMTVGAIALAPAGRRGRQALTWLIPFLLASGFWYVRNLIAVGNPFPWLNIPGLHHPAAPLQQHTGYSVAHYVFNGHVLSKFFEPGLASGLGPWWVLLLAIVVIGPVLCLLPGASATTRILGLIALLSLLAYLVTPESAAGPPGDPSGFAFNLRYAAPALTLCLVAAPLAPLFADRLGTHSVLFALAILLIATLTSSHLWAAGYVGGGVILAAVVAGACALVLRWRPLPVLAAIALLLVAGGYLVQRDFVRVRYAYQTGISSLARLWSYFRRIHDSRVGVVGTFGGFFSYPLYGIDDSNAVQYVALRGPHGSFTPIASCSVWRTTVDADQLRYLVTTPGRDPWHPSVLTASPEYEWTASDPDARLIYRYHALGQPIAVFELRGELDPAGCV